jgi:ABC-2 type transport system permease protein
MGLVLVFNALTLYMPLLVYVNGKISPAHLATAYLGSILLGGVCTAMGVFASSLFRSQLLAGITSGVIVVTFLTTWMLSEVVEAPFDDVTAYMALFQQHFIPFYEGRLELSGVVYLATLTWLFLTLTTRVLVGRRWE